jgi:hypothetical protein
VEPDNLSSPNISDQITVADMNGACVYMLGTRNPCSFAYKNKARNHLGRPRIRWNIAEIE